MGEESYYLTTQQVMRLLNLTYRQVDWIARRAIETSGGPGPGHYRTWTPGVIRQVQVACALVAATPTTAAGGPVVEYVRAVRKTGPPPPDQGLWIIYSYGSVYYRRTLDDVATLAVHGGVVAPLPTPFSQDLIYRILSE